MTAAKHETFGQPESQRGARSQIAPTLDATLVANFTHQIINPLNGVVGTIDNLIDGTIGVERRGQRLRAVRAQLSHTIELVRNLAFLSQITTEAGRTGLREKAGSSCVPEVIIEAAMFFQEIAADRGMKIRLEDRHSQYVVKGHRDLLRQVFTNLFENAVKYGYRDSLITISPRGQTRTGQLLVDIKNAGPGFDKNEKDEIFERGTRGRAAKERVASGSGLGLYLAREILDAAFEATIEAEHAPNLDETIFRIRFPRYSLRKRRRART